MARFNEILVGRYNRFLQKLLSMKGGPPTPQLASELQPVLLFKNGVENLYLEGWERFGIVIGAAAAAANQSGARLRNPPGSNVIAVVEKILVYASGATNADLFGGATAVDLATIVALTNARLDSRGRPQPTLIGSVQNTTPAIGQLGTEISSVNLQAATPGWDFILTDNQEIPILPGDAIEVVNITVNIGITVSFVWRERFLEDSERS